jgi:hypothetical protein
MYFHVQGMPREVPPPSREPSTLSEYSGLSSRILLSGFQDAIAHLPPPAEVREESVKPMPAPPRPQATLQSLEAGLRRAAPEPTSPSQRKSRARNAQHPATRVHERPLSKPINVLPVPGDQRADPLRD